MIEEMGTFSIRAISGSSPRREVPIRSMYSTHGTVPSGCCASPIFKSCLLFTRALLSTVLGSYSTDRPILKQETVKNHDYCSSLLSSVRSHSEHRAEVIHRAEVYGNPSMIKPTIAVMNLVLKKKLLHTLFSQSCNSNNVFDTEDHKKTVVKSQK